MKNGRFQEWKTIFHTRFCARYLQKNMYLCQRVINDILTLIELFSIYFLFVDKSRLGVLQNSVHTAL